MGIIKGDSLDQAIHLPYSSPENFRRDAVVHFQLHSLVGRRAMYKFILLVCISLPYVYVDSVQNLSTYDYDDDLNVLDNNSSKRIGVDPKVVMALMKQRLLRYIELHRLGSLRPTRKKHFPFHPLVRFRPTSIPESAVQEEEEVEQPERKYEEEKSVNAAEMVSALNALLNGKGKSGPIGGEEEIKSLRYGLSK